MFVYVLNLHTGCYKCTIIFSGNYVPIRKSYPFPFCQKKLSGNARLH